MKKNTIKKIALGIFAVTFGLLALTGCSKNNNENQQTTESQRQVEAISEIDAFVMSVNTVKNSYDQNKMVKLQIDDAASQAMVMEGFIAEIPGLYSDAEYKTKMTEIYNMVSDIDPAKEGLEKDDGADAAFQGLKQIVDRLYSNFK